MNLPTLPCRVEVSLAGMPQSKHLLAVSGCPLGGSAGPFDPSCSTWAHFVPIVDQACLASLGATVIENLQGTLVTGLSANSKDFGGLLGGIDCDGGISATQASTFAIPPPDKKRIVGRLQTSYLHSFPEDNCYFVHIAWKGAARDL